MDPLSRRSFLSKTVTTAAVASAASIMPRVAGAAGPNDTLQVGVIGVGGKGRDHVKQLSQLPGVRVAALCDVDPARIANGQSMLDDAGVKAKHYQDMRELLDDPEIDAVSIATPNHWHALATIWACQRGKDVYVEKPVTHNLWEGKQIIDAARKHNRVVQVGTQNRSDTGFRAAIDYIREGALGEIQWMHGLWFKDRGSIGHVTGPQPIPAGLDYNLWTGPAPLEPLMRQNLHYDWHWDWDTGNADMGNLGAHQLDDCAHALDIASSPKRFLCLGGRFAREDDGQTPNMQAVCFEFDDAPPFLVEVRGLTESAGSRKLPNVRGVTAGNVIQCENGYFAGGRGGGAVYDNSGKLLKRFPGDGGAGHYANWVEAVRSRNNEGLRAELAVGVRSANLCHLANLAFRSGQPASVEEVKSRVGQRGDALETIDAIAAHLKANNVDLDRNRLTCSEWMEYDPQAMQLSGADATSNAIANALVKPGYREPFVVPEQV
ncbi:Inositol 2-dehydrogenase [Posidoniimonas corsicana]|uniref:Inositol 2-dehydrogenase n=1 Tax=Posidoniimonas corsicana TaxID=1938618 RepID=A0A5C5VDQ0_9BACT|nr:Gfo/Idh/MocA family oxidoreductase [Posidoniimonas corsicana]TWT35842.1 Inositol 2-dehydrogenase [Posidoniimonas corsicana]